MMGNFQQIMGVCWEVTLGRVSLFGIYTAVPYSWTLLYMKFLTCEQARSAKGVTSRKGFVGLETTTSYRGYIGTMEKKMETTIVILLSVNNQ